MATGLQTWSKTAATNATADSAVNWAEGMAPSAVNDSARAEMASAAKYRDDNNATLVTSGSTTAYTVTSNQGSTAATAGFTIAVQFHATNDSSATLNVDSVGGLPMQVVKGTNLSGGEFLAGTMQSFTCSTGSTAWIARGNIQPISSNFMSLTATDQTLSGGANVTATNLSTFSAGTLTVDCGKCPLQFVNNAGAFTIAPPSLDGSCDILLSNVAGAGSVTFSSNFKVGANTGEATDTTSGHQFIVTVIRINSVATYFVKALQ